MADHTMADIKEKMEDSRLSSERPSPESAPDDSYCNVPANKEFEPISGAGTPSRPNTLGRHRTGVSTRSSVSRTRSNNGYGCDDDEGSEEANVEGGVVEKDQFDVQWEDGEKDPLNPRSMSKAKKWLVVLIVSASSFCV